jgi:hypothetical protein
LAPEDVPKFRAADNLFRGAVISALHPKYEKSYISFPSGKDLWDTLEAKFDVSDARSELYLMEQLFNDKNHFVVEQAHEIQALTKELELFPYPLPNKFVAGSIIAKLPPSWKDFATSLKHKRQEFNVAELISTLDVEERARAKDKRKGVEISSANMVLKKNSFAFRKNKKKNPNNKQENTSKPVQTAQFKKKNNNKKKGSCFVCGSEEHWTCKCPDHKFKQEPKKSANMITTDTEGGTSGYGNHLPTVLSVCNLPRWWMDGGANIHICADVSLFASY